MDLYIQQYRVIILLNNSKAIISSGSQGIEILASIAKFISILTLNFLNF